MIQNKFWRLIISMFFFIFTYNIVKSQEKRELKNKGEYELVKGWPQLSNGFKLSQVTGVGVDNEQNIFIFQRTGRAIKVT